MLTGNLAGRLLLCVGIYVIARLANAILRARRSALRKVPGPLLNRLSDWPLSLATMQGRRVHWVHSLHEQYGDYVILSPSEVSINDVAAAKEIHRIGGGFLKAPWYANFTLEDGPETGKGIFSMRDPKVHSARRKLFARAFSQASLNTWDDVVIEKARMAIGGIRANLLETGKADILSWFTFMANDVIATLSFGTSFRSLEEGKKTQFITDLETTMKISGIGVELNLPKALVKRLTPIDRLVEAARAALGRAKDLEKQGHGNTSTIFAKIMAEEGESLSTTQIEREASNFIVAGSDTTAVSLTYLTYAVLSSPAVRDRIQHECADLPENFTVQQAMSLPYLRMVIKETLRLYGAAPGALPRSVPTGGRTLGGYFLQPEVVVSTQAYSLHRRPEVFEDPLVFRPDRWEEPTSDMKDAYMPFGGGTRVCIGLHLAEMELAYASALFFKTFETARLAPETTAESMAQENYFLIAPRSHRCIIVAK